MIAITTAESILFFDYCRQTGDVLPSYPEEGGNLKTFISSLGQRIFMSMVECLFEREFIFRGALLVAGVFYVRINSPHWKAAGLILLATSSPLKLLIGPIDFFTGASYDSSLKESVNPIKTGALLNNPNPTNMCLIFSPQNQ